MYLPITSVLRTVVIARCNIIYRNHRLKGVAVVEPSIDNTEQGLAAKVVDNMSDVSMSDVSMSVAMK